MADQNNPGQFGNREDTEEQARKGGEGEYRIRVGSHRVVYDINVGELIILVLHLGHCRDIYRKL